MVKSFCQTSLASNESEVFGVIFLDSQHRVLRTKEMFNGTIDA
ncbi:JAB domain-containing protein, partial [Vibrio splendidus]